MLSDRLNFWTQGSSMRPSSVLLLAGGLAITPPMIGCTSGAPLPAPPTPGQAAAKAVGNDYIIGPGDTLEVFVWRNPELSVTVPVRPDGKISTPLVENMVAVGKTPPQLARDMEGDRKSTRLNSSHSQISYAVFCLKKKKRA